MTATWADPTTTWAASTWAWDGTDLAPAPTPPPVAGNVHPGPHTHPLEPRTVHATAAASLGAVAATAAVTVTVHVEDDLFVLELV